MEPLTDVSATSEKKSVKASERVSLGAREAERLERWLTQTREASRGFLQLTRADLVAFLISEHREDLSPSEIKRLRSLHYDPVKHMQWIVPEIKAALMAGDTSRVVELQAELRNVELSVIPAEATLEIGAVPKTRASSKKRTRKLDSSEDANVKENTTCLAKIEQN